MVAYEYQILNIDVKWGSAGFRTNAGRAPHRGQDARGARCFEALRSGDLALTESAAMPRRIRGLEKAKQRSRAATLAPRRGGASMRLRSAAKSAAISSEEFRQAAARVAQ
jgi:hypothetical protein